MEDELKEQEAIIVEVEPPHWWARRERRHLAARLPLPVDLLE